jgi:hypothetical protein
MKRFVLIGLVVAGCSPRFSNVGEFKDYLAAAQAEGQPVRSVAVELERAGFKCAPQKAPGNGDVSCRRETNDGLFCVLRLYADLRTDERGALASANVPDRGALMCP